MRTIDPPPRSRPHTHYPHLLTACSIESSPGITSSLNPFEPLSSPSETFIGSTEGLLESFPEPEDEGEQRDQHLRVESQWLHGTLSAGNQRYPGTNHFLPVCLLGPLGETRLLGILFSLETKR